MAENLTTARQSDYQSPGVQILLLEFYEISKTFFDRIKHIYFLNESKSIKSSFAESYKSI